MHGPLKSKGLGEYVQKLDYVYNLQGWLKAINHPLSGKDPGEDYYSNGLYARDVFGEILNYYAGDYKRTGSGLLAADAITPATNTHVKDKGKDLFNGNISSTVTYTGFDQAGGSADPLMAQGYRYDYLNRLVSTFTETALPTAFSGWSASSVPTLDNIYQENLSYDANGNIKTLERTAFKRTVNSVQTTAMDMMTYHYDQSLSNSLSQNKKAHNKLLYIDDAAADDLDIEDFTDQAAGNYAYDAKGRLIRDVANEIDSIAWTAYDKVREVIRTDGSGKPRLSYTYDGFGRRLSKTVTRPGLAPETSYYVYDGGGNQMALYLQDTDESEAIRYRLAEHVLYGASREGVYKNGARIGSESVATTLEKSAMLFEVSDHLGNVRAVVSGQKVTVADIPSYQYHFGFESAQDAPDQYWDSWVFSKDEKYSGEQSVYVTGFGHSAYVPVEPGDTISAEAMMKFVTGTQGGFIYMALQDENGQNEIGRRSDQVDAGAHQNINTWSRIYQSDLVVPAGKYRLYFYLRVNTSAGNSPSWFDDFKVTVRGKNARPVEVADIITLTDYYPFGMAMPGRTLSNSEHYRYGFNGMEKDDDWYGAGNEYTTEFRQLDVRVGRWMSMDPMMAVVPDRSPYEFSFNNPVVFTDPSGLFPGLGLGKKGGGDEQAVRTPRYRHEDGGGLSTDNNGSGGQGSGEGLLSSIGSTIKGMGSGILRYTENKVDWMQRFKTPEGRAYNVNSMKESIRGTYDAVVNPTVPHLPNALGSAVIQFGRKFGEMSAFEQGELIGELAFGSIDGWAYGKVLQGSIQFARIGLSPAQKLIVSGNSRVGIDPSTLIRTESGRTWTTSTRNVAEIMKSAKVRGITNPVDVFVHNGKSYIINGHHRVHAAQRLGINVPVNYLSLPEKYSNIFELQNAAFNASLKPFKVDGRMLNSLLK